MPDSKGRPKFDDFATAADVDAFIETAPSSWRNDLLMWEYALLRNEMRGLPRPVPTDIAFIARRAVLARQWVMYSLTQGFGSLVFGWIAISSAIRGEWVMASLMGLAVVGLVWRLAWLYRLNGGAMRLVWDARDASQGERLAILERAVRLDRAGGDARVDGGW